MAAADARERGFMYVEVLVALAVLGFALLALTPSFLLAQREGASSGDLTTASMLALDKAEELTKAYNSELPSCPSSAPCTDTILKDNVRYEREWTIDELEDNSGNVLDDLFRIRVTVAPQRAQQHGESRTTTMEFIHAGQ